MNAGIFKVEPLLHHRLVVGLVTGKLDVRPAARQLPEETQPEAAVPADELAEEVEAGSTGSEEES
jgi:hypothetical protein